MHGLDKHENEAGTVTGRGATEMVDVSDELRRELWNQMIGAHMRELYYARRAGRRRFWGQVTAFCTAVFSSATLVAALDLLNVEPTWPALVAAVAGIIAGTGKFGEAAMAFTSHSVSWSDLHARLRDTWIEVESWRISHDEAREILSQIHEVERVLDREVTAQRDDERLVEQCFDRAEALALS